MTTETTNIEEAVFDALADTDHDGGLTGRAAKAEPGNFLRHAASLSLTKSADGLIDPKLVLSWLLSTLGAPAMLIGLLVPVREAGALLPQLLTAPHIHAAGVRKWFWAAGSAVQGLAAAVIVVAGLTLEGTAAGITIVIALAILALARSVCSVSYKDILGKTVGQTRRGTATGLASSTASVAVILFALILMTGMLDRFTLVIAAIALAAAAWLLAAAIFATLTEEPTPGDVPDNTIKAALAQLGVLREDRQLVLFIAARGLLVGTALAPPFLVVLTSDAGQSTFEQLGSLVLASSIAAFLSSYLWGRLADISSRKVLILAGLFAAAALGLALVLYGVGVFGGIWAAPLTLFLLMLAYNGVRQGRSTYLVDMAPEDQRATYTAVSNTVIGIVLLGAGVFGAVAASFGAVWTVAIFAAMSVAGAVVAARLDPVAPD